MERLLPVLRLVGHSLRYPIGMESSSGSRSRMTDRYELVVCQSGLLELRDPDDPDRWIKTDTPAEIEQ